MLPVAARLAFWGEREMMLGVVGSWVAGKHSEASREISYWAVRSEGACQARPQGMESLEWRWKAVREPSRFQIFRRAGVSLGERWLGLWEACRLEIGYVRSTYW